MATTRDYRLPESYQRGGDREYPAKQPRNDEQRRNYAAYTRALWDEQEEALEELHDIWIQNMLFLINRQWWTKKGDSYSPDPVASWRKRPVTNLCLPFLKHHLSKATKIKPTWVVMPSSLEPQDVKAAALAQDVLEGKYTELGLAKILRRAVTWALTTGNAYLYPYWNNNTGRVKKMEIEMEVPIYTDGVQTGMEAVMVPLDEDGNPQLGKDGRPKPGAKAHVIDEGDIGIKVISPFSVRVDPEATCDEEVTWFIIGEPMTMREIQERWPDKFGDDLEAVPMTEDISRADEIVSQFGRIAGGDILSSSAGNKRDAELPKAMVYFYHEKPTLDYPDGRYWCCTKDVMLEDATELPEGLWPSLIHLQEVVVPGRYHGMSTLESVVPINREYNEHNGVIQEEHQLMMRGKWLVAKGSGITKANITSQPGEVIVHNPGLPPQRIQGQPLPPAVYQERNRIMDEYHFVAGVNQASMGKLPPGSPSGVAILQLQEADDTDLGPFLGEIEEAVGGIARSMLRMIKDRYTDERLVMVVGPNKKYQVRAFKGSDLEGTYDVITQAGSAFPWSQTARQAMFLNLLQQNPDFFTDPETGKIDQAKFARMLPMGGMEAFTINEDLDAQEADREEEMFSIWEDESSETPTVEWWQNHEVHFNHHVRMLKSGTFREWNPEAQEAFMEHVRETMKQRDQKRAETNIANGGTPPGGQAPPGAGAMPGQMMEQQAEGDPAAMGIDPNDPLVAALESDPSIEMGNPAGAEQAEMLAQIEAMRASTQ